MMNVRSNIIALIGILIIGGCKPENNTADDDNSVLQVHQSDDVIEVTTSSGSTVLKNIVKENHRPYIHPLLAPDGNTLMTEYSPDHHKHQTGIYWGMTRVNGRDFFHNPGEKYWRKVQTEIIADSAHVVSWATSYEMLDSMGEVLMLEVQTWKVQSDKGFYIIDLEWDGRAIQNVVVGEYDYGGLFVRMPWTETTPAKVINAARHTDLRAEGQRAMWLDLGMQIGAKKQMSHIAIFDHPQNRGYPTPWRVDGQFGVGPARCRLGDWEIKAGNSELLRYRLAIYQGEQSDVEITKQWENFSERNGMYSTTALWGLAQEEGREAKFLTPTEAVESMTIKNGYQVNVWASEPDITQPMAFCYDHKGRIWVAENRDYESRGDGFSNSGDSRILILEDSDQDGVADSRKVFMEGIAFPAALAVGFDGVFLGAPPHLLFVPDRDQDDKADIEDIEIRLTGWGIRDRHETLNSLHWGPDGWLYGCQGFATPSKVHLPEGGEKIYRLGDKFPEDILSGEGVDINGGVWRYHPSKHLFEVVAHGFSNPWGIDYDAHGQLLISACVIPHLWHVIPGGIYHRQGGQHFNPYVYKDIQTIADHRHRSAHGGARVYLSDAFPTDQYGRIFMANIHEHALLSDILIPSGSGFTATHGEDFVLANNAQWIGFSLEVGPDGAIYILDWHDADICGKEVTQKETGRIFRVSPQQTMAQEWPKRYEDLSTFPDSSLIALLSSTSSWHQRRARLILQERATTGSLSTETPSTIDDILHNGQKTDIRLNALWSLHTMNQLSDTRMLSLFEDSNPYVRAWTIQLACEDSIVSENQAQALIKLSTEDRSPVVRLYLAAALQRVNNSIRKKMAAALLSHARDTADHNIPLMLWYGIEPLISSDVSEVMKILQHSEFHLINQFTGRKLTELGLLDNLLEHIQKVRIKEDLLVGIKSALEHRTDIHKPAEWEAFADLEKEQRILALISEIDKLFGDKETLRKLLSTVRRREGTIDELNRAIHQLSARREPDLLPHLEHFLHTDNHRMEAIRAVSKYSDDGLADQLIRYYPSGSPTEKKSIVYTLASRSSYGWKLTTAIKEGIIPKTDIPAHIARQLRRVVGSGFVEVWGPVESNPTGLQQSYLQYKALLANTGVDQIDMDQGQKLYDRVCGSCHVLFGQGGNIGPDITGSNRTNLDYLLSNILEPSAEIQDDYLMTIVSTHDGMTVVGNILSESNDQLVLRVVGQNDITIDKASIRNSETTTQSLMPIGLLNNLTDHEKQQLLGYLMYAQEL